MMMKVIMGGSSHRRPHYALHCVRLSMGTFANGKGKDLDTCYSAAYIKSSLCIVEMGENRTRTELEPTFWRKKTNRTRTQEKTFRTRTEPINVTNPNPNLLTQVLVGFDKFVD